MNGIAICFRQTEWAQHLLGLTLGHMISNDTAGTDKFIGITSAVYPLTFAMTLMSCRDTGE